MQLNLRKVRASVVLLGLLSAQANAFVLYGVEFTPVPDSGLNFRVDIPGISASGVSWNDSFAASANEWSAAAGVPISVARVGIPRCGYEDAGYSGAAFLDLSCDGVARGAEITALAYGTLNSDYSIGASYISFMNSTRWDVYDGALRIVTESDMLTGFSTYRVVDFGRITKHEMGHILGLNHGIFPRSIVSTPSAALDDTQYISIDDMCGVLVSNGREEECPTLLRNTATFSGDPTSSIFIGGASSDLGVTYQQNFVPSDTIDVMATIVVEKFQSYQNGKLFVVFDIDGGGLYSLGADGSVISFDGTAESLNPIVSGQLKRANEIYLLNGFVPADGGVSSLELSVFLGYSMDSEPGEVYFSQTPIIVRVGG